MPIPRSWLRGELRVRYARRLVFVAMLGTVSVVLFVSREDRGSALALAGQLVLGILVTNLAWVVWEVRALSRGLEAAGLDRAATAQLNLAAAIRQMVGVLAVMLIAGTGLMWWAAELLPQDPSGDFALMFWVLLASGFSLSIYVSEMITHLIHAFEAALMQMAGAPGESPPET